MVAATSITTATTIPAVLPGFGSLPSCCSALGADPNWSIICLVVVDLVVVGLLDSAILSSVVGLLDSAILSSVVGLLDSAILSSVVVGLLDSAILSSVVVGLLDSAILSSVVGLLDSAILSSVVVGLLDSAILSSVVVGLLDSAILSSVVWSSVPVTRKLCLSSYQIYNAIFPYLELYTLASITPLSAYCNH